MTNYTLPDPSPAVHQAERGVIWMASEGQIVNAGVYVFSLLFCWLIWPPLYALYRFLLTNAHVYKLTDQRLLESRGLLFKSTEVLELYRVKDLSIEQPLMQRMAGCGRVILLTSDRSTPTVVLNAIAYPHAVSDALRDWHRALPGRQGCARDRLNVIGRTEVRSMTTTVLHAAGVALIVLILSQ